MGKREMLERALGPFIPRSIVWSPEQFGRVVDALAEQAIVIEARVRQYTCCTKQHEHTEKCGWDTIISLPTQTFLGDTRREIGFRGRQGVPGKHLFIGLPLEEQ